MKQKKEQLKKMGINGHERKRNTNLDQYKFWRGI